MSTKLEQFLARLPQGIADLLAFYLSPLHFARESNNKTNQAEESTEVDLGPPVGVISVVLPKDPDAAQEAIDNLIAQKQSIAEAMTDEEVAELERLDRICIAPQITAARELHAAYPVFGILIAQHDEACDACDNNGATGFEDRMADAIRTTASLSDEEQNLIIDWARDFQAEIFPPEVSKLAKRKLLQELTTNPLSGVLLYGRSWVHRGGSCDFTRTLTRERWLWLVRHPYFCRDLLEHLGTCRTMVKASATIETENVRLLPANVRAVYFELHDALYGA